MQNYHNPAPPPGGYGPAPPPAKKGMSTGVKILIAAAVLVVGGGVLLVALAGAGVYLLSRKAQEVASASRPGLAGLAGPGGAEAEPPSPTAEQRAAVAGGQSAAWEQQEISWTVPQKWKKHSADSTSLLWRSPGSWDAASLIVSISPTAADFPSEFSLKTFYDSFEKDKQKYAEVRWLKLGGVKGVMFRESAPESADSPQRLQWMGYRDYKGQKQLVNIMLASRGKDFARHEDALYGILYSTDLGR
ncbi:MAG TPA: hypothetical protein VF659_15830 [Pyrinomonadaceae bacterium]|jgi:hypothetical protein